MKQKPIEEDLAKKSHDTAVELFKSLMEKVDKFTTNEVNTAASIMTSIHILTEISLLMCEKLTDMPYNVGLKTHISNLLSNKDAVKERFKIHKHKMND